MKRKKIKIGEIPCKNIHVFDGTMSRNSLWEFVKKHPLEETMNEPKFKLQELANSMKKNGQIECIGVIDLHVKDEDENLYQLAYGLRRFLCANWLEWKTIKAVLLW